MQTFLPYASFTESAKCLDMRRLGKQRVEARQILNALAHGGGWAKHPVTKMWRGYEIALLLYSNIIITEWVVRGYKNNMEIVDIIEPIVLPWWLGKEEFHKAHRSNLLRKNFEYYSKFNWTEQPDLPYWYPINIKKNNVCVT